MSIQDQGGSQGTDPGDGKDMIGPETPAPEPMQDDTGGEQVPLSLVGDSQPGDTVTLEVVSRDEDSGMATVKMQDEGDNMTPAKSSIREAASKFED